MPSKQVSLKDVLGNVFSTTNTQIANHIIFGTGTIQTTQFHILGTEESTIFGVDEAMEMAKHVLSIDKNDTKPIILLVDVVGQKLSKRDEWLGMYACFAHLLKCLHLARKKGHKLFSLIYNQAIGGSFIAFGMMADRIYALPNATLAVMWLEGMAKVTKIDIDVLKKISETSPVFAPGVDNFKKLGGLHEVLSLDAVAQHIMAVINEANLELDNRAKLGKEYGGRTKAFDIIAQVENL